MVLRIILLIKHKIGGLSYVRTLLMSNPPRIYCAQHLASPDNVTCWHITALQRAMQILSSILTIFVTTTHCIPIIYKRIFISMTYKKCKKIK